MPHKDTLIHGQTRARKVVEGAKAIIASTTPELRYFIRRCGFAQFEGHCRREMANEAGLSFTSTEIRRIWDIVGHWMMRKESHLAALHERQYQGIRRGMPGHVPPFRDAGEEAPLSGPAGARIVTENKHGVTH